jgi:hypothetical protein
VIVAADDPLFSMPLGVNEEAWTVWLSREKVWERYRTLGQVAVLEGGELEVSFSWSCSFYFNRLLSLWVRGLMGWFC